MQPAPCAAELVAVLENNNISLRRHPRESLWAGLTGRHWHDHEARGNDVYAAAITAMAASCAHRSALMAPPALAEVYDSSDENHGAM